MKVLFKNTTQYNKENCNKFVEFHQKKYGKKDLFKTAIFTIAALYIVIFNIIYRNWLLVLGILLVGVLFFLLNNYRQEKKAKERAKIKNFTFYFYKNHIKIKYKNEIERLTYFNLYKVFETEKYFYLYLDEKSSLILAKSGFEIGTPEEFSNFIKSKCPFKFSKENKSTK